MVLLLMLCDDRALENAGKRRPSQVVVGKRLTRLSFSVERGTFSTRGVKFKEPRHPDLT